MLGRPRGAQGRLRWDEAGLVFLDTAGEICLFEVFACDFGFCLDWNKYSSRPAAPCARSWFAGPEEFCRPCPRTREDGAFEVQPGAPHQHLYRLFEVNPAGEEISARSPRTAESAGSPFRLEELFNSSHVSRDKPPKRTEKREHYISNLCTERLFASLL